MFTGVNFSKPPGASPAAAAPKEPNITIIAAEDISGWPMRDSKKVNMLGNFGLIPGARMFQFYHTALKFNGSFTTEGDDDAEIVKQKVETEAPGDGLSLNEFLATWTGVPCIIIFGSCADPFKKVYGTKCSPLRLKASSQDNSEARKKMLVFEQSIGTEYFPGHYTGAEIFSEPYAAASGIFAINAANGNYYQLPSLAVTDAVEPSAVDLAHGQIVTLIGGGGAAPATLTQGTAGAAEVILLAGTTWTALQGAVIHLQVYDAGGDKYLIEQSRG